MTRLLGSSILLTALSLLISLNFLLLANDLASFSVFALVQINQAYSISLNNSLFYTPLFGSKYYRSNIFFRSQMFFSAFSNLLYSIIIFVFIYFSVGELHLAGLVSLFVFVVGMRSFFRGRASFSLSVNDLAFIDFLYFFVAIVLVFLTYNYPSLSIEHVLLSLMCGCISSMFYIMYKIKRKILLSLKSKATKSYIEVLKSSGFIYVVISIISELNSNLYAYLLPLKSGHSAVGLPSFSIMCFRPFNLVMTSVEENLRLKVCGMKVVPKNLSKNFFVLAFLFLVLNYSCVLIVSVVNRYYSFGNIPYISNENFFLTINLIGCILFFRIFKQALLVNLQLNNQHNYIFVVYSVILFFSLFSVFMMYQDLNLICILIVMLCAEFFICVSFAFISIKYFKIGLNS